MLADPQFQARKTHRSEKLREICAEVPTTYRILIATAFAAPAQFAHARGAGPRREPARLLCP